MKFNLLEETSIPEILFGILFVILLLLVVLFGWYLKMTLQKNDLIREENYQYYTIKLFKS